MIKFDKERYLKIAYSNYSQRELVETFAEKVFAKNVKNIFLTGCGGAFTKLYSITEVLKSHLSIPVYLEYAAELVVSDNRYINANSLVIVGSQSGDTPETLQAVRHCKERGATVVGFIGKETSKIGDSLDYLIYNEENDIDLILLNIFVFKLLHLNGDFPNYIKFSDELKVLPEMTVEVLERLDYLAADFAKKYKREPFQMWVTSGNIWGEVKCFTQYILEEMQWLKAQPIHSGDFFHGPFELVDENLCLVVVKGIGRTLPLDERVAKFSARFAKKLTIFDMEELKPKGINEQFFTYVAPYVLNAFLDRVAIHFENNTGHSLDYRRYYRKFEY